MQRGIDRRRDHPAIFARDRVELVAERDRNARPFALDDLADAPLMRGVDDRPQEADGDRLDAALLQVAHGLDHVGLAERRPLVAQRIDPAAHLAGPVARHEGLRIVDEHRVGPLAGCLAQGQHVGVALVAQQPDRGDLALDQRVGRHRGAVDDQLDPGEEAFEIEAVPFRGQPEGIHEAALELARRGRRLEDLQAGGVGIDHQVGEGAADIDAGEEHLRLSFPAARRRLRLGAGRRSGRSRSRRSARRGGTPG